MSQTIEIIDHFMALLKEKEERINNLYTMLGDNAAIVENRKSDLDLLEQEMQSKDETINNLRVMEKSLRAEIRKMDDTIAKMDQTNKKMDQQNKKTLEEIEKLKIKLSKEKKK